jgi:glycosyltransferase involved in cell wall biosynthesis
VGSLKVIYSFGGKLGSAGVAPIARHDLRALEAHGLLQRLLCGFAPVADLPRPKIRQLGLLDRVARKLASHDASGWLLHAQNVLYDTWASRRLESADLLVVWSTFGLRSLRRAREKRMRTAVLWASTHPLHAVAVLDEEYRRWGGRHRPPAVRLRRKIREIEEADHVILPAPQVEATYLEQGTPRHKLISLRGYGVDADRYRPREGDRGGPFRVLFVGGVSFRKGMPYLLEAWERLRWADAELCLVGAVERRMKPVLQRRVSRGVRLTGHVPDPVALFQSADVFVLPSLEEGSARVTYEAMACGLPVITTAEAGSPITHGENGFVVPARNVDALVALLDELRADEDLRRRIGGAARNTARALSWAAYETAFVEAVLRVSVGER